MDPSPDPTDVAAALRLSIGLFLRQLRQAPVHDELPMPETSALVRLERGGPTTSADLARLEQISPQGMGATVARLEERGLIERRPDPGDRRRVLLSVTEAGGRVLRNKRDAKTEHLATVLASQFTPSELDHLMAAAPLIERLALSV
jgi:DNA-binding MarR family transcriptional regulator